MTTDKAPYALYATELDRLARTGRRRGLSTTHQEGKWITTGDWKMLNLSSNDYLGLADDAGLREEFLCDLPREAMRFSASSSRLLTGSFPAHERLERTLASLYGNDALVFSSGYHMNTGILPAICDRRTLILADKLVHASLIDGIRLSQARCIRYRHHDYDQLEALLTRHHAEFDRLVIVTESIFSMDGDISPLPRLVELRNRFPGTLLYVDEAHAVGVRGRCGLGLAEEQGCLDGIDLLCGTFGKALASAGAFVICAPILRDYLVNKMRTLIFTTALPPVNMEWTHFIVKHLPELADRRERLSRLAACLREVLRQKGLAVLSESHIVPLMAGTSDEAVRMADHMRRHGFYVLPIRPPTVPEGTARLRISLTANLDTADIDRLADTLYKP